ncbi:hypothetical protein O6H91_Y367000 [Diphasiastrum complanatum]|nr:hypothetical protein O6H91_Y367000 [Diphasiastrum complanatum]
MGCALMYAGQAKLHHDLSDTLEYVVDQSRYTVENLHTVAAILMEATVIDVDNIVIAPDEQKNIRQQSAQLNSSADQLEFKTEQNAHKIRRAIENVRLVMIIVAGVMLLLVLAGLLFVAFGVRSIVYSLVFIGWLLVAATWILCGVFILLNNAVGDTCVAMQEWVAHPEFHTNLDEILPCVDQQTSNGTLNHSKNMTITLVDVVNQAINGVFNNNFPPGIPLYFNQSGPKVPPLCSPYGPAPAYAKQSCPAGYVDFRTAPQTWSQFVCTAPNGVCTSTGRLTPEIYNQLLKSVTVADGLYKNVPFLVSVENCDFARTTFQHIINNHCTRLRRHLKWIWIGLVFVSGGSMISIFLWVLSVKRHPRHTSFKKSEQG